MSRALSCSLFLSACLCGLAVFAASEPLMAERMINMPRFQADDAPAEHAPAAEDSAEAPADENEATEKAASDQPEAFLIPKQAGPEWAVQGEYSGDVFVEGGVLKKHGVQIIAIGDKKFHAKLYVGGLPNDGWDGSKPEEFSGELDGEFGIFKLSKGTGTVKNAALTIENADVVVIGTLVRTDRESKTMGMKPPEGASFLLESSDPLITEESLPNWVSAKEGEEPTLDDVAICPGVNSKEKFQDCIMHIEFMLPFMPKGTGQGRANSGVYLQGRYEVQVLDSFGLEGKNNECGAIYEVAAPKVNMCFPPLVWQTYDIKFTAAKFDAAGKKTANARMTVLHNGVKIHDNVEVPNSTRAAPNAEGPEANFLHLQDHGSPVRYRNIWVLDTIKARKALEAKAGTAAK